MEAELFYTAPHTTRPNSPIEDLTKREYFAAMAMQGYISCGKVSVMSFESLAIYSVEAADALIAELNK
jgi:hypothetical protein